MKKRIILPAVLLTGALAAGALGFSVASAQENGSYPPIIQKLAQRFNLNEAEVQDVFEEIRDEQMANMEADFATHLEKMVSEGKITDEQKQKILDNHNELQEKMEEWKNLSPDERHEKMRAWHEEHKIEGMPPVMMFNRGDSKTIHAGGEWSSVMFVHKLD